MKLCRFNNKSLGVVIDQEVADVSAIWSKFELDPWRAPPGDPLYTHFERVCSLVTAQLKTAPRIPLSQVTLNAPVCNPSKIIGAPVNYQAHFAEAQADFALSRGKAVAKIHEVGLFLKASSSLTGPAEGIKLRFPDRRTDHELELVVVIGKPGTDIRREDALRYVAGYTIGLDMTLRGAEDRSLRKSIDGYTVIGPWLVTADEIPDPQNLQMQCSVNGINVQSDSTANMILGVAELIQFASSFYTLYPGDLIMTGTPAGVGPVVPGDLLCAKISAIGAMEIRVR